MINQPNVGIRNATAARQTTMVAMDDGIRLATDVLTSTRIPTRGTIIERTPYGRRSALNNVAAVEAAASHYKQLCDAGYTVVVQDCRGTGDSEGEFSKYINEAKDGVATIKWASEQPWWGAGAYLTGISYSAHAALAAAVAGAPGILGLLLDRGGFWSAYHEGIRVNGAFELKQVSWSLDAAKRAARETQDSVRVAAFEKQNLAHWLTRLPWSHGKSPLRFYKQREQDLLELWDQEQYSSYWDQPSISARGKVESLPGFPSLHISSWYDIYPVSTVNLFKEMGARTGGDAYMILGPWTHPSLNQTHSGDVDFGPAALLDNAAGTDYIGLRKRWLDYCSEPGGSFGDRVRFFVMGGGSGKAVGGRLDHGGEWFSAEDWPPPPSKSATWKLAPNGELHPPDSRAPETESIFVEYQYDPANPVPTIGGGIGTYKSVFEPGAFDQREDPRFFGCKEPYMPLLARPDIICFTSAPLSDDVIVAGNPVASLDFSTSAADTDITVKLIDQYPPSADYPEGFALNLCDTVVRLRCQENLEPIEQVSGTAVFHLEIEMPPIANRFVAGHSIRLDVSSSNFPRFDPNPNILGNEPRTQKAAVATNGVRVGGRRGSSLLIPVVSEQQLSDGTF